MKKILTVTGMLLASLPAGILLIVGFIFVDLLRAATRQRHCISDAKVTQSQRDAFKGRISEYEFKVGSVGPRVL